MMNENFQKWRRTNLTKNHRTQNDHTNIDKQKHDAKWAKHLERREEMMWQPKSREISSYLLIVILLTTGYFGLCFTRTC